jgi:hypothetical protein
MTNLTFWMIFQVFVGIWLFVSPYVLGEGEMNHLAVSTMVIGVVVSLIGIGVALFEEKVCHGLQGASKKTT